MHKLLALSALATTLAFATQATAKTYPHPPAGVSINIPDTWKVDGDDNTLTCESPSGAIHMFFTSVPARKADAAVAALEKLIRTHVKKLKTGKEHAITVNGMQGAVIDGTGVLEGHAVEVSALALAAPTGQYILAFGVALKGKAKAEKPASLRILKGLKPLPKKKAKAAKKKKRRGAK